MGTPKLFLCWNSVSIFLAAANVLCFISSGISGLGRTRCGGHMSKIPKITAIDLSCLGQQLALV
jgi:hypothetical protein